MGIKNKFLWIFLILIVLGISIVKSLDFNTEKQSINKNTTGNINSIIKKSNISEKSIEAEEVIKKSFKYRNNRELDKLLECYKDRHKNDNFRFENLEVIEINNIELEADESIYWSYLNNVFVSESNLDFEELRIYKVKYYIEFKDDTIEPIKSGNNSRHFYLIKEKDSGKWLIQDTGDEDNSKKIDDFKESSIFLFKSSNLRYKKF